VRDYPRIIGLNGVARAGKDTVAGILHDLYGYEVFSYSETLNDALINLNPIVEIPWEQDVPGLVVTGAYPGAPIFYRYAPLIEHVGYEVAKEIPEVRRLLQAMGTEVGRNMFGENIWVDALMKKIEGKPKVAITNVRFPNEAEAVWSRGGEVWEVIRPGFEPALGHTSDTALDAIVKDAYIYNDGDVRALADKVIKTMDDPIRVGLQEAFAQ
jgi:hypothetical protein